MKVIFLGATGAVGSQALQRLLSLPEVKRITLLGRREVPNMTAAHVEQHKVSVFDPSTYDGLMAGHDAAICTLGVGEPRKVSREDFIKVDKLAVIDFAKACKAAGVRHFELLASVGVNANSANFFLRTKGELVDALKELNFERLSILQPSMILTPTNRYGLTQGVFLKIWPWLNPIFQGPLKKYRGIKVEDLGAAFAENLFRPAQGVEYLEWEELVEF